ncbi:MAG: dTDP-4-dehydrorhamnose 3,5-epimerase [Spirochaetota bacterium]
MPFEFRKTAIDEVLLVQLKKFSDERGFFTETYKKSDFESVGINEVFVQDNHSHSVKGVLRGLHFQRKPFEQGKLVRCVKGAIFDVAVDIRKGSITFGKWVGYELTEENGLMLWIPRGFAHAFLTLTDRADVMYKVSGGEYAPDYDAGIRWDDPEIGIKWPFETYGIVKPLLSPKDEKLPYLQDIMDKL